MSATEKTIVLWRRGAGVTSVEGDLSVRLGLPLGPGGDVANNGSWLQWHWDGVTFHISNDHWGMYPCYWAETPEKTVVSTSIAGALRHVGDRRWNDDAMAVFVRLGYFLKGDTHFAAVHALPPGVQISTATGVLQLQGVLSTPVRSASTLSRQSAMELYVDAFDVVARQTLASTARRPLVPLSGGRDSRHILFALRAQGADPLAITASHFAPKPDEDQRVARLVCQATRSEHNVLEQPLSRWEAERKKNALLDCTTVEHAWYGVVRDRILAEQAPVAVWDGIAGDVLSAGHFLTPHRLKLFDQGRFEEFADELLARGPGLAGLLGQDYAKTWHRDRAIAIVAAEAERHAPSANPVGQFFLWNRTRRGAALACWGMTPFDTPVIAPFLDRRVSELLEALPASYFVDFSFHTEAIHLAYPQYEHIPFESKDAKARLDPKRDLRFARDVVKSALQNRSSVLAERRGYVIPRALLGATVPSAAVNYGWIYQTHALLADLRQLVDGRSSE